MNKKVLNGVSLALTALLLTACSDNDGSKQPVIYQGVYEILTDGSCELKNGERSNKNMVLRIDKAEAKEGYNAKVPSFMSTVVPWQSNLSVADENGLTMQFDNPGPVKVDDGSEVQINMTVRIKPHPNKENQMLVTQFDINKSVDGKVETRDFVSWYNNKLSDTAKANAEGLCAINVTGLEKPRPSLQLSQ